MEEVVAAILKVIRAAIGSDKGGESGKPGGEENDELDHLDG